MTEETKKKVTEKKTEAKKPTLWDRFETNKDAEVQGVWIDDFFSDVPGISFKIAKFDTDETEKVMDELRRPYKKLLKVGGKIPKEKADAILTETIARCVLVDWRGVLAPDGTELPYNKDNAIRLLTELPEVREKVLKVSADNETYNRRALEEAKKN